MPIYIGIRFHISEWTGDGLHIARISVERICVFNKSGLEYIVKSHAYNVSFLCLKIIFFHLGKSKFRGQLCDGNFKYDSIEF